MALTEKSENRKKDVSLFLSFGLRKIMADKPLLASTLGNVL